MHPNKIMCTGLWTHLQKNHKIWLIYSLPVELLILKYRRQNISVSVTLISAVTDPEVTFADRTTLLTIE